MSLLDSQTIEILNSAIDSVKPAVLIKNAVSLSGNTLRIKNFNYNITNFDHIYVIGAGKASAYMAKELEKILGNNISGGVVITKYGHSTNCSKIKVLEAGHPVIDENSIFATEELLKLLRKTGKNDLVIVLISGGGSSLMEALPKSILLNDLQITNELLLKCGARIEEINSIRKSLSLVKGGKLINAIYPSAGVSLIISDIINDPIKDIASGPTVPQNIYPSDALSVIEKYNLQNEFPENVIKFLKSELAKATLNEKAIPPKVLERITNIIIGNNKIALSTAIETSKELGFNTYLLSDKMQGEAKDAGKKIAVIIKKIIYEDKPIRKPVCLLFGGETTVTLTGTGLGGRNQELILSALLELKNVKAEFSFLSCGTDGTDGPTDAAGAIINNHSWEIVNRLGLNPVKFLGKNDSYNFFNKINSLVKTGPTGTNVMDIGIALIK